MGRNVTAGATKSIHFFLTAGNRRFKSPHLRLLGRSFFSPRHAGTGIRPIKSIFRHVCQINMYAGEFSSLSHAVQNIPQRVLAAHEKPPPVPCGAFFVDPPIRWGPPARVMDPTTRRPRRGWACMRRTFECLAPWQVDIGPTKKDRPVTYTAEVLPSLAVPQGRSSPYLRPRGACRPHPSTYTTCADFPVPSRMRKGRRGLPRDRNWDRTPVDRSAGLLRLWRRPWH